MSRRSEPASRGPWWARPSAAERDLQQALRHDDQGRWICGDDPWCDCGACGLVFDTSQFHSCPGCVGYGSYQERQRFAALALEAAATGPGIH